MEYGMRMRKKKRRENKMAGKRRRETEEEKKQIVPKDLQRGKNDGPADWKSFQRVKKVEKRETKKKKREKKNVTKSAASGSGSEEGDGKVKAIHPSFHPSTSTSRPLSNPPSHLSIRSEHLVLPVIHSALSPSLPFFHSSSFPFHPSRPPFIKVSRGQRGDLTLTLI